MGQRPSEAHIRPRQRASCRFCLLSTTDRVINEHGACFSVLGDIRWTAGATLTVEGNLGVPLYYASGNFDLIVAQIEISSLPRVFTTVRHTSHELVYCELFLKALNACLLLLYPDERNPPVSILRCICTANASVDATKARKTFIGCPSPAAIRAHLAVVALRLSRYDSQSLTTRAKLARCVFRD